MTISLVLGPMYVLRRCKFGLCTDVNENTYFFADKYHQLIAMMLITAATQIA